MTRVKGATTKLKEGCTTYAGGPFAGMSRRTGVWTRRETATQGRGRQVNVKWENHEFLPADLPKEIGPFTHYEKKGRKNVVFTKTRGIYRFEGDRYHWHQTEVLGIQPAEWNEETQRWQKK